MRPKRKEVELKAYPSRGSGLCITIVLVSLPMLGFICDNNVNLICHYMKPVLINSIDL